MADAPCRRTNSGWEGLIEEISSDLNRIAERNLGRDDRIISDHGREGRFPFLDRDVVSFLNRVPIWMKQVEATTVQNCFKHAGFSVCAGDADDAGDIINQTLVIVDQACETLLAEVLERQGVRECISFPDFRVADGDVQTSPEMFDEATVASVVEVLPNDSDEDDMGSDNTGDPDQIVAEAAHCVSVMRLFSEKKALAKKLACSISEFEAAVVAARLPHRQMKITDFVMRS
ncbi:hypothetical protein HPB51_027657 [Rhipicephalus microplus]|uniref:Asparagine synthetase domain-containing protein n=1 Tax=Rhipicephalus microplus TaxID=6941 RepID=A0A9J6CZ97_RHIMP|nr:hypothetical protein HPB51_027657 [Rhipicephalus microplus]